jgi:hypothetical protein
MRNVLHADPWKRLICALALAAATALLAPASPSNALPYQDHCPWYQSTIIKYYSDSTYTHQTCADILYPCPGYSPTSSCAGSETPYTKRICNICPEQ